MGKRGRFVRSAPFLGWTNGLSPWFEINKKIKKCEEVLRDAVAKKRKKNKGRGF